MENKSSSAKIIISFEQNRIKTENNQRKVNQRKINRVNLTIALG